VHFDSRLWLFTKGFRWRIFLSFLVGVFAVGVGVARLASLGWLLSRIIGGAGISELLLPIIVIALLMFTRGALEYSRNIIAHQTAAGIQLVLRRLLFDKLMMLGPGYVTQQRSGELALTLVDGIEQLETYFGRYLPQLMVSAVTPIIIFGFVSFIDLPVSIVLLTASIVALFAPALWHRFDTRKSLEREQAYGEFAAEFLDSVQGLSTLKSFGQSSSKAELLTRKARDLFRTTMWVLATNSLARGITDTSIALGAAIALVFGAHRVAAGTMELSALLIILLLGVEIFRPMRELRSVLHQGMVGRSAAIGVYRIFDANPEVQENSKDSNPPDLKPSIGLKDVVFKYPGKREIVHQDLTFKVEPGERVGIVGPSGCGKSTIVRALQRFYDPISGTISIGGIDIRQLSLDGIRSQISAVYQDTFLFHGTVRENLHMGKPGASKAELDSATQAANIYDFIMELPQGYDTVIGERGIKLCG
jgi:ATP-binding cassette subfamily C protein CydCD